MIHSASPIVSLIFTYIRKVGTDGPLDDWVKLSSKILIIDSDCGSALWIWNPAVFLIIQHAFILAEWILMSSILCDLVGISPARDNCNFSFLGGLNDTCSFYSSTSKLPCLCHMKVDLSHNFESCLMFLSGKAMSREGKTVICFKLHSFFENNQVETIFLHVRTFPFFAKSSKANFHY